MTAPRLLRLGLALGMILLLSGVPTKSGAEPPPAPKLAPVLPTGHAGYFPNVALSQDGKRLVTVCDTTALLWDLTVGKQLEIFEGHRGMIMGVALAADGKYLATGALDKTAILWKADTGEKLHTFEHAWPVLSVALSADGKHLVTGSRGQPTILWEAATGKKLQTIGRDTFRTALSANGKHVVTTDNYRTTLWETATGKALQTFPPGSFCVALSADGKKVLTVGLDPVFLWEAASGEKLGTFHATQKGEDSWVTCLALSVEGDLVLAGTYRGKLILWEAATGKKLHTFQGHTIGLTSVALSADGRHAWSASSDGTTRLWDTKSGKELCSLLIFEGGKDWLCVTPAGFFDGSPGAWKRLSFRDTGTAKVLDDDATKRKFYRPGLLGMLSRGEKPQS